MNREKLISIGLELESIVEYDELCARFEAWKRAVFQYVENEKIDATPYRMCLHVVDIPFGTSEAKREKYILAIKKAVEYLNESSLVNKQNYNSLETIISNFGLFLQNMYELPVENKATLQKQLLEQIVINNEYDLQHIMYAVIKTLYPSARREVNQDMGYGTVRFDIAIEENDTVIELKCTRKDHNEGKLCRELGEDAFFYQCANLIIFVYDKEGMISDVTNFIKALERTKETAGKEVRVFVEQKKNLI